MSALSQLLGRSYANLYGGKYEIPMLGYKEEEDQPISPYAIGASQGTPLQVSPPVAPMLPQDPNAPPSWLKNLVNMLPYAAGGAGLMIEPLRAAENWTKSLGEQPSSIPGLQSVASFVAPVAKEARSFAQGLDPMQGIVDLASLGGNYIGEKIFDRPPTAPPTISTHEGEVESPIDANGNYNVGFAGNTLGSIGQMVAGLLAGGAVGGMAEGGALATKLTDIPKIGNAIKWASQLTPWLGESTLGTALGTGVGNAAVTALNEAGAVGEGKKKLGTAVAETALSLPVGMLYAGGASAAYPLLHRVLGEVAINVGGGAIQPLPSVISGEMPVMPKSANAMDIMSSYTGNVALQGVVGAAFPLAGAGIGKAGKMVERIAKKYNFPTSPVPEKPPIATAPTQGEAAQAQAAQTVGSVDEVQIAKEQVVQKEQQNKAINSFVKNNFKDKVSRENLNLGKTSKDITESISAMADEDPTILTLINDIEQGKATVDDLVAAVNGKPPVVAGVPPEQPPTVVETAPIAQEVPHETVATELPPEPIPQDIPPQEHVAPVNREDFQPEDIGAMGKEELQQHYDTHQDELPQTGNPIADIAPTTEAMPEAIETATVSPVQEHVQSSVEGNPDVQIKDGVTYERPKPFVHYDESGVPQDSENVVVGNPTEVMFNTTTAPAYYVVHPADYSVPSHRNGLKNPYNFLGNPQAKEGQEAVEYVNGIIAKWKPDNMMGTDKNAFQNTPKTILPNGEPIQGNTRAELEQRIYENPSSANANKIKKFLLANAEHFGINTPEKIAAVEAMPNPTVSRVVNVSDAEAKELSHIHQNDASWKLSPSDASTLRLSKVSQQQQQDAFDYLSKHLSSQENENKSFKQLLSDGTDAQYEVAKILSNNNQSTLAAYLDNADANLGVNALERDLRSMVFARDNDAIKKFDKLPNKYQDVINANLANILRLSDDPLGGDFKEAMQGLFDYGNFKAKGKNIEHWLNQAGMDYKTNSDRYSPGAVELMKLIDKESPSTVKRVLADYAANKAHRETGGGMFDAEPMSYDKYLEAAKKKILKSSNGGVNLNSTVAPIVGGALSGAVSEQIDDDKEYFGMKGKTVKNILQMMGVGLGAVAAVHLSGGGKLLKIITKRGEEVTMQPLPEGTKIVDGFYSPMEKRLREVKKDKDSAAAWLSFIGKKDEAEYTGLKRLLEKLPPRQQVSKAELLDHLDNNRITLVEKVKDDTLGFDVNLEQIADNKYHYQAPNGGNDYTLELLPHTIGGSDDGYFAGHSKAMLIVNNVETRAFRYITTEGLIDEVTAIIQKRERPATLYASHQLEGESSAYQERLIILNNDKKLYASPKHFNGEPNIVVHSRSNIRDAEGKKTMFVEESQSDWGQAGREEGFVSKELQDAYDRNREFSDKMEEKYGDSWDVDSLTASEAHEFATLDIALDNLKKIDIGVITTAPFVKETPAWTKLGIKYDLIRAVKEDVDRIAWTTGEQQNERWSLLKKADRLDYNPASRLFVASKNGVSVASQRIPPEQLPKYIGKELAEKLLAQPIESKSHILKGKEIEVGGAGMKAYYGSPKEEKLGIYGEVMESLFGKGTVKKMEMPNGEFQLHFPDDYKIPTKEEMKNFNSWNPEYLQDDVLSFVRNVNGQIQAGNKLSDLFPQFPRNRWTPSVLERLEKLYGAEQRPATSTQHYVEITPAIRAQVQAGMSLFNMGAALAVPDNDEPIYPGASVTNRQMRIMLASASIAGIVSHPTMLSMIRKLKISMPETKLREVKPVEQTAIPGYGEQKLKVTDIKKPDIETLVGKARADGITDELLAHHLAFMDGKPNSAAYIDKAQTELLGNVPDAQAESAAADYLLKSVVHAHNGDGDVPIMSERLHDLVVSTIDNSNATNDAIINNILRTKHEDFTTSETDQTSSGANNTGDVDKTSRNIAKREEVRNSLVTLRDGGVLFATDKKGKMTDGEIDAQMSLMDGMADVWKKQTGNDTFYDTFINGVKEGDINNFKDIGGTLFQDGKFPATNVTLAVFKDPAFARMENRNVFPSEIAATIKNRGRQIEKDLISEVLAYDKYKGTAKIPFAAFKADVDLRLMKLERIKSSSYATYGLDNVGLSEDVVSGLAETVILNTPLSHGITGHFGGANWDNATTVEWEIKQIPTTDTWVAIDKNMPAGVGEADIQSYVGTAGTKEAVEQWVNTRHDTSQQLNKGMFGHFRGVNTEAYHVTEIQSDVYQKVTQEKLAETFISAKERDEISNRATKDFNDTYGEQIAKDGASITKKANQIAEEYGIQTIEKDGSASVWLRMNDFESETGYIHEPQNIDYPETHSLFFQPEDRLLQLAEDYKRHLSQVTLEAHTISDHFDQIDKVGKIITAASILKNERIDLTEEWGKKRTSFLNAAIKKRLESDNNIRQFMASEKNHFNRIYHEAVAHAAQEGATTIRIPDAHTIALIEGYISDDGAIPYDIIYGEADMLGAGDIIELHGDRYTVVEANQHEIAVVPDENVSVIHRESAISNFVDNEIDDLQYDIRRGIGKGEIDRATLDEWEPDGDNSIRVKKLLEEKFDELDDDATLSFGDVERQIEEEIHEYISGNLSAYMDYGHKTYYDDNTEAFYVVTDNRIEYLNQPYQYGDSAGSRDFEDFKHDLSDTQTSIVKKYIGLQEYIKKTRKDAKSITDDNGFGWLEHPLTADDANSPIIAFQNEGAKIKGAVDFTTENKATIHLFDGADISTLAHEFSGHVGRRFLDKLAESSELFAKDYDAVKKWANVRNDIWTRGAEEKFARGFEKYLYDGKAPTQALKNVFAKFRSWLTSIYQKITGSSIDVKITPEVKKAFDRLVAVEQAMDGKKQFDSPTAASSAHTADIIQGRENSLPEKPIETVAVDAERISNPSDNWQDDLYLAATGDDPLLKRTLDKINKRELLTDEEVQAYKKYVAEQETWDNTISKAAEEQTFDDVITMGNAIKDPMRRTAFTKYVSTKLDDLAMDAEVAAIAGEHGIEVPKVPVGTKPQSQALYSSLLPLPPGTLKALKQLAGNRYVKRQAVGSFVSYLASDYLFDEDKTYLGMSGKSMRLLFAAGGGLLFNTPLQQYTFSKFLPLSKAAHFLDKLHSENLVAHDFKQRLKDKGLKEGTPEYAAELAAKQQEAIDIDVGISKLGTSVVSLGGLAAKGNKMANGLEDVRNAAERSGREHKGIVNKLEKGFEGYPPDVRERVNFAMAAYDKELGIIRAQKGTEAEKDLLVYKKIKELDAKWFKDKPEAKKAFDTAQEAAQHGRQIDVEAKLMREYKVSWKNLPAEIIQAEKDAERWKKIINKQVDIYATLTSPKDKAKAMAEIKQSNKNMVENKKRAKDLKFMQALPELSKKYHYLPHFWDKRGNIKYAVYRELPEEFDDMGNALPRQKDKNGKDITKEIAEYHKFDTDKQAARWLARFKREKAEGKHDFLEPRRVGLPGASDARRTAPVKINELISLAYGDSAGTPIERSKIVAALETMPEWKALDPVEQSQLVDRMNDSVTPEHLRQVFEEIWKPKSVNLRKRKMIGGYLDANIDAYLTGTHTPQDSKALRKWVFGGLDHLTSGGRMELEKSALLNAALAQQEYLLKEGFGMTAYYKWLKDNVINSLEPSVGKSQKNSKVAGYVRSGLAFSQLMLNPLHAIKNYGLGSVSTITEGGNQSNIIRSAMYFAMAHPQLAFNSIRDPKLRVVWDKLKALDIGETQYYNHVMMNEVGSNQTLRTLMIGSIKSEEANNKLAGLTFAKIALNKGMTIDEAVSYALKMRQRTQYSFTPWMTTKVERSIRQSFGGFGSTAMVLMGAALRGAEHAGSIYFRAAKQPRAAMVPALAFVAMTTMFGGLAAEPFIGTAIDAVKFMDKITNANSDDTSITKENHIEKWQRQFGELAGKLGFNKDKAEKLYLAVQRGLATTLTNVNLTQNNNLMGLLAPIMFSEGGGITNAMLSLFSDKPGAEKAANFMRLTAVGNRLGRAGLQLVEGHPIDSKGNVLSDKPYKPSDAVIETAFGRPASTSFNTAMKAQGGGDLRDEFSRQKFVSSLYAIPGLTVGNEKNAKQREQFANEAQHLRRDIQKEYEANAKEREKSREVILQWASDNKPLLNWIDRYGGAEAEGNLPTTSRNSLENSIEKWYTGRAVKRVLPAARFSERKSPLHVATERLIASGANRIKSREQKAEYRSLLKALKNQSLR